MYFLLRPHFGTETLSWMCILGAAPFAVMGFVRYNGMNAEQFVWALPIAAGCEEVIYSSRQMFSGERKNRESLGVLADMPVYSIPYPQIKKIAALKNHIWGL